MVRNLCRARLFGIYTSQKFKSATLFFYYFSSVLLAVSQFSLQHQTGEYVITIPLKGLALFSTLYPGGTEEYCYTHFQNAQVFALSGGVSLKILIQSDHCHAGRVFIYT